MHKEDFSLSTKCEKDYERTKENAAVQSDETVVLKNKESCLK